VRERKRELCVLFFREWSSLRGACCCFWLVCSCSHLVTPPPSHTHTLTLTLTACARALSLSLSLFLFLSLDHLVPHHTMAGNLTTPNFSQPGWYAKYTSKQVTLALAFGLLGGGAYYVYKESLADSYNQAFKDAKKVGCCVFFFCAGPASLLVFLFHVFASVSRVLFCSLVDGVVCLHMCVYCSQFGWFLVLG
jgi:hypothetical protein